MAEREDGTRGVEDFGVNLARRDKPVPAEESIEEAERRSGFGEEEREERPVPRPRKRVRRWKRDFQLHVWSLLFVREEIRDEAEKAGVPMGVMVERAWAHYREHVLKKGKLDLDKVQ